MSKKIRWALAVRCYQPVGVVNRRLPRQARIVDSCGGLAGDAALHRRDKVLNSFPMTRES